MFVVCGSEAEFGAARNGLFKILDNNERSKCTLS